MAQFMLLIRGDDEVERSPSEAQSVVQEYIAWSRKLREENRMLGGDGLASKGRVVRLNGSGLQVSDGPYTETKEVIGGYDSAAATPQYNGVSDREPDKTVDQAELYVRTVHHLRADEGADVSRHKSESDSRQNPHGTWRSGRHDRV